jgi:endonuclease/exonuclease/phosphatase family metal-dependent hydrolase
MNREISVVSLNMAKATSLKAVLRDFRNSPAVRDADVLLLQEVASGADSSACAASKLAAELGRYVVSSPAAEGVTDQGLAILSRWPLEDKSVQALKSYDLRFRSRSRIALSATARTPHGPVRIWNTHLDTRLNARDRLEQLAPVLREAAGFSGPRIVGGDFNSNPFYWVGRVLPLPFVKCQAAGVREFMTGHGFSTPVPVPHATYDYLRMNLDWVWAKDLQTTAWAVYPMGFSDHHAVLVRMGW